MGKLSKFLRTTTAVIIWALLALRPMYAQAPSSKLLVPGEDEQQIYSLLLRVRNKKTVVDCELVSVNKMLKSRGFDKTGAFENFILVSSHAPNDKSPVDLDQFKSSVQDLKSKTDQFSSLARWKSDLRVEKVDPNLDLYATLKISFSVIGFNSDRTRAVVYRDWYTEPDGGRGEFLFLEKQQGVWTIVGTHGIWGVDQ